MVHTTAMWFPDYAKLHTNANNDSYRHTHLCLTWAVPGLHGRDLSHSLLCTRLVSTVSAERSDRDPHILLCCLFLSVHHSFAHSPLNPPAQFFSFASHAFPPCLLAPLTSPMPSIMRSCSLLLLVPHLYSYRTSASSSSSFPFFPYFPFLSLFVLHFWHTMDGLLLCILLSFFTSAFGYISILHISTVSSLILPTLLFSIFFHVFCFLPHSLCLSHTFLFLPWTSDYLSAFLSSSLLPTLGPSPPQAGAHTLPDLSTRQQSLPTASPLSRSNLCSLLYSAPSGMAVVSGKFSASSWMQPPPSSSSQLLLFSLLHRRHPWFHIHTAALAITTMVISMPSPTRKPLQAGQRAGQLLTVFSWRLTDKMILHTVFKRQLLTQEVHQYPWKFSGWRDKQILNSAGKFFIFL